MIPPPLPYFQAFSWMVMSPVGAPRARAKKENCRRKLTTADNMLTGMFNNFEMIYRDVWIEINVLWSCEWAVKLVLKMGGGRVIRSWYDVWQEISSGGCGFIEIR
jgi:hypothetical protein